MSYLCIPCMVLISFSFPFFSLHKVNKRKQIVYVVIRLLLQMQFSLHVDIWFKLCPQHFLQELNKRKIVVIKFYIFTFIKDRSGISLIYLAKEVSWWRQERRDKFISIFTSLVLWPAKDSFPSLIIVKECFLFLQGYNWMKGICPFQGVCHKWVPFVPHFSFAQKHGHTFHITGSFLQILVLFLVKKAINRRDWIFERMKNHFNC